MESTPPQLDKVSPQFLTPTLPKADKVTKPALKANPTEPKELSPEAPLLSPNEETDSKRPRKGTPYRVDRLTKEQQEQQRIRASNLDRILQQQCQGTPVILNRDIAVRNVIGEPKRLIVSVADGHDMGNGASTS